MELSTLVVSKHAGKRYQERVNLHGVKALEFFKNALAKASNIGKILGENNELADCYLFEDKRIIVRGNEVVTVTANVNKKDYTVNPILHKFYQKELKRIIRECNKKEKYIEELKYEAEIEVAELKYRAYKTKSKSVKLVCDARLAAIEDTFKQYERELLSLYKDKSFVSNLLTKSYD